jgi:RHS repeat-associated protein
VRDQIGSVIGTLDVNGNILGTTLYDAYGNAISASGPATDFGYAGMLHHAQTGFYLTQYREYNPTVGRWLSRDPIGLNGGVNAYAYVGGNPISFIDPTGLAGIYVVYPNYPITIPGTNAHLELGHAAVIALNTNTGETHYYEYGRYGGNDFGAVRSKQVPNVQIENGEPTTASLQALYNYISIHYGDKGPVDPTYYPNADYQKIIDFALKRMHDPNRAPYSWMPWHENTCYTFARDAIVAGLKQ